MLTTRLLHPQILAALGEAGHGATVLIADGNYPVATRSNPAAHRVFLNLEPGKLTVTEVLDAIAQAALTGHPVVRLGCRSGQSSLRRRSIRHRP